MSVYAYLPNLNNIEIKSTDFNRNKTGILPENTGYAVEIPTEYMLLKIE